MQACDTDLSTIVTAAVRSVTCGIAPHAGRREAEEYHGVPIWLRNRNGLPADEVAAILATERPELGIESENDLLSVLDQAARERRHNGLTRHNTTEGTTTMPNSTDPKEALQEFATMIASIDPEAVELLRTAWKDCYRITGHKALARYLLTGDMAFASKSLEKRMEMVA